MTFPAVRRSHPQRAPAACPQRPTRRAKGQNKFKDGGDIELIDVKDNIVYVKLQGNCNGCPMSFSTMKLGVENTIKQFAPEIVEVIEVE